MISPFAEYSNMEVYAVFEIFLDGDGYRTYDLVDIAATVEKGLEITSNLLKLDGPITNQTHLPHDTMTSDNNFTYVGNMSDLKPGPCDSIYSFQGYLIQKYTVQ